MFEIIDFMYYGKVNICQENINTFLKIATELQLKGLKGENIWGGEGRGDQTNFKEETDNPTATIKVSQKNDNPIHTENLSTLPQSCFEDQINVLPR